MSRATTRQSSSILSQPPPSTPYLDTRETFAELGGLDPRLVKAAARLGFTYPTLVQAQAIPLGLLGRDLLVRAKTGSGKTAAYGLVLLHKLLEAKGTASATTNVFALVLVPTRELVEQTTSALTEFAYYASDIVRIVGLGAGSLAEQAAALKRGADVVVGTPGKLLAHLAAGSLHAEALRSSVSVLVIDEADLVLSYGGGDDVKAVVAALPRITHTMLVSATLSTKLDDLRRLVLHNPAVLRLEEADAAAGRDGVAGGGTLSQFYVRVPLVDRYLLLFALLKLRLLAGKTLIFTACLDTALRMRLVLERFSVAAAVLNAELPANSRRHIIAQFNKGVFDLLIATDEAVARSEAPVAPDAVASSDSLLKQEDEDDDEEGDTAAALAKAREQLQRKRRRSSRATNFASDAEFGVARGVDFRGVTTVVNFDFPPDATTYAHRIGRTARGGASGVALSFVAPEGAVPAQDALLASLLATGADGASPSGNLAPLPFDPREVEGFRYRVTDVLRSVNAAAVRAARLAEVRREVLSSDALRGHFEDNPRDLAVLRQADKPLLPTAVRPHLKRIPGYLLPPTLRAAIESAGAGVLSEHSRKKAQKKLRGSKGKAAPAVSETGSSVLDGASAPEPDRRQQSAIEMVSRAASEVYRPRQNRVDPLRALAYQAASTASALAVAASGRAPRLRGGASK